MIECVVVTQQTLAKAISVMENIDIDDEFDTPDKKAAFLLSEPHVRRYDL